MWTTYDIDYMDMFFTLAVIIVIIFAIAFGGYKFGTSQKEKELYNSITKDSNNQEFLILNGEPFIVIRGQKIITVEIQPEKS